MLRQQKKLAIPTPEKALPGRDEPMKVPDTHFVNGNPTQGPFPEHLSQAVFGLGCFWGAERRFWETPGVFTTAAGYAGGIPQNPTYEEVCSGMTGHTEAVLVVFDPDIVSFEHLLAVFCCSCALSYWPGPRQLLRLKLPRFPKYLPMALKHGW